MVRSIDSITKLNYREECFSVIGNRTEGQNPIKPYSSSGGCAWHLQVYKGNSVTDAEIQGLKRKPNVVLPLEDTELKSSIDKRIDLLRQHLERRVQLFFQQAILCYDTPFIYDAACAEDQIGIGSKITTGGSSYKSEAAHSSTLPCLHAYFKKADGTRDGNSRFVFLKYSSAYDYHNSTIELPAAVNKADILIDNKLRREALEIINQVANAQLEPVEATRKFILKLEKRIIEVIEDKDDIRSYVCQKHVEHLSDIKEAFASSNTTFDMLVGVNLSDTEDEAVLRNVVYKQRFEVIQQAQLIENKIARLILNAENKVNKTRRRSLKNTDNALRYALLEDSNEPWQTKCLEKLFCTSLSQLQAAEKNKEEKLRAPQGLSSRVKKYKSHAAYKSLQRELREQFRDMTFLELEYRSKLFKGLRIDYKNWRQVDFVAEYKSKYPSDSMSQSMVSRLEEMSRIKANIQYATPLSQRRKPLDINKAKNIANVYGIDLGLFLPALIASSY